MSPGTLQNSHMIIFSILYHVRVVSPKIPVLMDADWPRKSPDLIIWASHLG